MWPPTGQYQQKYLVETSVSILKKQQMLRWSPFFFIHCPFLHPSSLNTDMIPGTWAVILKYENEDHTWWDFLFSYLVSSGTRSDRMNMGTWRGHFNTLNCLSPVFLNRRREIILNSRSYFHWKALVNLKNLICITDHTFCILSWLPIILMRILVVSFANLNMIFDKNSYENKSHHSL